MFNNEKFKNFYKTLCNAAVGVNIGIILFGILSETYVVIPLAVINCVLLSLVYVMDIE